MTVLVQVARRMARMVMVRAWPFRLAGCVAMAVLVQIARGVTRVVVVGAWLFRLAGGVAMPVLVQIAWGMTRVVVMLTGLLFLWHVGVLPQQCTYGNATAAGPFRWPGSPRKGEIEANHLHSCLLQPMQGRSHGRWSRIGERDLAGLG